MRILVKFVATGLLLAGFGAVQADEVKPEDAVKYRQSVYTAIKWNFAPMGAMMKGGQRKNADLKDDQMVDVSFYVLPL